MAILLPAIDEDPQGLYVDQEDFFQDITLEEVRQGLKLGDGRSPIIPRALAVATHPVAVREANRFADHIKAYGYDVRVEIQSGVSTSGWLGIPKVANYGHHTVSRRSMGSTPCLGLVKRGRPDVVGPLCNGYGGFDEVARLITMGWANHAGLGGPITLAGKTIPRNNGRPYGWGWEFEGGLDIEDFTNSYRRFMAACCAGTLDYYDLPTSAHIEHKTWAPTRKIDRLGYTAEKARAEIDKLRANPGGVIVAPIIPPKPKIDYDEENEDMDRYIEGFFRLFLGRSAGEGEVDTWLNVAASFPADHRVTNVRDQIRDSEEAKNYRVIQPFREFLNRDPSAEDVAAYRAQFKDDAAAIRAAIQNSEEAHNRL